MALFLKCLLVDVRLYTDSYRISSDWSNHTNQSINYESFGVFGVFGQHLNGIPITISRKPSFK